MENFENNKEWFAFANKPFFLHVKECLLENPRTFYGSFTIGPFRTAQGLTVANALRRTLLTEIFGVGITSVFIDGAVHEYSTLEGVRESVLDLLFAFKAAVFKSSVPFGTKPVYGYLHVRGPGIVRMADMKLPPGIVCVDPDQYIATLSENGKLIVKVCIADFSSLAVSGFQNHEMEAFHLQQNKTYEQGSYRSFASKRGNKDNIPSPNSSGPSFFENKATRLHEPNIFQNENAMLHVDGNIHPIRKVNYMIENLRPSTQSLENELVHIELWTNGSLHPRKAMSSALFFLKNMFDRFEDMEKTSFKMYNRFLESDETVLKILKSFEYNFCFFSIPEVEQLFVTSLETGPMTDIKQAEMENEKTGFLSLDTSIDILNLPYRVTACLRRKEITTLRDLVNSHQKEIFQVAGIGNFSAGLIQKKLKKIGLSLKQ